MNRRALMGLLERVQQIAREAGEAILKIPSETGDVTTKADGSPLTRADLASHRTIEEGLKSLEPGFPILSEEGDLAQSAGEAWQTYWCVDPLDGTKEFVKGLGEYTVNIALIERGTPILGVIYAPATETLYYAASGLGSWKIEAAAPPRRICARNCDRPTTAVVSRSHLSEQTEAFLARLNVTNIIRRGSSLKLCAVAEGQADIYPRFGPTYLWDTAAGTVIALEANSCVTDMDGKPLSYDLAGRLKHSGFLVYPSTLRLPSFPRAPQNHPPTNAIPGPSGEKA